MFEEDEGASGAGAAGGGIREALGGCSGMLDTEEAILKEGSDPRGWWLGDRGEEGSFRLVLELPMPSMSAL